MMRDNTRRFFALALFAVFLLITSFSLAETLETSVNYISATAIYIDAGRVQGIQTGDGGEIRRGDSLIARIEVEFVADNSSSCRLLESTGIVRVGDRAIMHVTPQVREIKPDTSALPPSPVIPAPEPRQPTPAKNRVTGRISAQALSQNDRAESNRDFRESALVLRGRIDNIVGTQHTLSVRLRSRTTDRDYATTEDWIHRVYELALYYNNPDAPFHYGAGRILSNRLSGIGYLDGAMLDYRLHENWTVGAFGGTQPDFKTSGVDTDQSKAGIFASYDRGSYASTRFSGTLAAAGTYWRGEISREFLYEQVSYSVQKLFLYQSAELNINRGWRKEVEGSSLDLSNVLLNARYSPLPWLTTTLSYDNRTTFRTYETRLVPDSMFDDALRQGWRLGAHVKLPSRFYILAEAGLRMKQNEGVETRSASAGIGSYNLLATEIQIDARVNAFRGRFSEGYQPSVTLSRNLIPRVRASVQYGFNQYTIVPTQTEMNNRWLRLSTDWNLSQHVYGSLYGEMYRGDGLNADRGFIEVGYRF